MNLLAILRHLAYPLIMILGIVIAGVLVAHAARRVAARRIAEGEWDENGPLHPTEPKPWEKVGNTGHIGLHLSDDPPPRDAPGRNWPGPDPNQRRD